ncbi:YebG family protein [Pseudidiomarina homiensis]|uniref:Damage-inducible protein n=1 Tax=Pseudidiomarina homiensis TaxID=364198 RepID=A0A432Y353_9GAMM|nr:YebG family protein [Pseudidiomarina homiensis]RUO55388.1 damage-inducible protein [Pseudidiomarina homiensis]
MAVVTQYVVMRDGEEKMTFTTKAEADAHDKMLDMVDELLPLLERSETITEEKQLEDLAFFLAREREQVLIALGAKKPTKKKTAKAAEPAKPEEPAKSKESEAA